ncbi:hypothetical protein BH20ACT13_BH20ACT13_09390 [soil metagenome]
MESLEHVEHRPVLVVEQTTRNMNAKLGRNTRGKADKALDAAARLDLAALPGHRSVLRPDVR